MKSKILGSFDTMPLGNGFFLYHNKLYFFSKEELAKETMQAFENLKDTFKGN